MPSSFPVAIVSVAKSNVLLASSLIGALTSCNTVLRGLIMVVDAILTGRQSVQKSVLEWESDGK